MRYIFLMLLAVTVSACSNLPTTITDAPAGSVDYADARQNAEAHRGRPVRWGGSIISVETEKDSTWVQILQYPLGGYGRPALDRRPAGRFMLHTAQFLDPAIYREGLSMTAFGHLNGEIERVVGEKAIKMPLVEAQEFHLWEDLGSRDQCRCPWPGYGWYPYYPYYYRFGYGPYFY